MIRCIGRTESGDIVRDYPTIRETAKRLKVHINSVRYAVEHKTLLCGLMWEYCKEKRETKKVEKPKKKRVERIGRCVAVDQSGMIAMTFDNADEAAKYIGVSTQTIAKYARTNTIYKGYLWATEKDYIKTAGRGKLDKYRFVERNEKTTKKRILDPDEEFEKQAEYALTRIIQRNAIGIRTEKIFGYVRPWVKELVLSWVGKSGERITPWMLADYYTDKRDKEIALLAALLIYHDSDVYGSVEKARKTIGEHPWDYFSNRFFADKTSGRLGSLLNEFWTECFSVGHYDSIGDMVDGVSERDNMSYLDVLLRLTEGLNISMKEPLSVFLLVVGNTDGIGLELWDFPRKEINVHFTTRMKDFLMKWIPEYWLYGSAEDCVSLLGMEHLDFFVFYLAYRDLRNASPEECAKFEKFYKETYTGKRVRCKQSIWDDFLPKTAF